MTRCLNCRYWLLTDGIEDLGECRRRPPPIIRPVELFEAPQSARLWAWPITHATMWCGEYRNREDAL